MSMKKAIIQTNDALAYIAFACVALAAVFMVMAGKILPAIAVLVGGWLVCSLIFGAWFVLSDMADSLRKISEKG